MVEAGLELVGDDHQPVLRTSELSREVGPDARVHRGLGRVLDAVVLVAQLAAERDDRLIRVPTLFEVLVSLDLVP